MFWVATCLSETTALGNNQAMVNRKRIAQPGSCCAAITLSTPCTRVSLISDGGKWVTSFTRRASKVAHPANDLFRHAAVAKEALAERNTIGGNFTFWAAKVNAFKICYGHVFFIWAVTG